ncbi:DUF2524 family protein [Alkalihalobacillus pseudalcaliphilus]|uniref:DUF2524 family protein n=1 Tax=Alkalihalobacillus pseudalcaliphilus TaxID=79884 RepID=UPI00064E0CB5|nr:DUF2524 family protein [Alkalihalobacillus pseudalcaliphilus]KMK76393.1 hypothetical protein AB990_14475 [Alkalihalobacillus pseudalcaliphilus]
MTVRKQLDNFMNKAEETMQYAEVALANMQKVQPMYLEDFQRAQLALQEISEELTDLKRSATKEQQYHLSRTEEQLRQLQNRYILKDLSHYR